MLPSRSSDTSLSKKMNESTSRSKSKSLWFDQPKASRSQPNPILRGVLGLFFALVLWWINLTKLAYFAAAISTTFWIISLIAPNQYLWLEGHLATLGVYLGRWIAYLTLTPIYFTLFPLIRLYDWISQNDPLALKHHSKMYSYWRPADHSQRVIQGLHRSYLTERLDLRRKNHFVAVGTLLLAILLCSELYLRFLGFGEPVLYERDLRFGYRPAPSQKVIRRGSLIEINQWGMRAPSFRQQKSKNTQRVLILGDSTLWGGSYTPQERIYARQAERQINQSIHQNHHRVEVLNMGVNGWGPEHKLGFVETYGTFDADIAVVTLPHGDLIRPLSRLAMTPFYPSSSPPIFALQEVLYHLSWRFRTRLIGPLSPEQIELRLTRGVDAYAQLAIALHQRGARVRFELLPSLQRVRSEVAPREERYWSMLRSRLSQLPFSIQIGDATHELRTTHERNRGAIPLYHDSVHLSPYGHDIYAQYLSKSLLRELQSIQVTP